MTDWKDGMTTERVAKQILRNYLIRCHRILTKGYPDIAGLDPTNAADYLLHLRDAGRIDIQLSSDGGQLIDCRIVAIDGR